MILDGKNQSGSTAQQFLFPTVRLSLQGLLGGAADPFAICAARRPVGRQGRVAKRQRQVTVVTEEVGVLVLQLLLVLKMRDGEDGGVMAATVISMLQHCELPVLQHYI